MKLSLITMQGVYNYGSALQTYASQKILTDLGCEVEIIDYYPNRMRNYGSLKQLYTDAKPFHKNRWKCMAIAICKYPSMIKLKRFLNHLLRNILIKQEFIIQILSCAIIHQ